MRQVEFWWQKHYFEVARINVQIMGPKSVRLFHAYKDKLFVSIELDYLVKWYLDKGDVAKDLPTPPDRQLRTGKLPADFTGYFAAYTAGGRDYLVTNTGKVYMAAPKGKTEVEVSAIWTDPKRAIMGVVQDRRRGTPCTAVGFVTDSRALERFYVKLGPQAGRGRVQADGAPVG